MLLPSLHPRPGAAGQGRRRARPDSEFFAEFGRNGRMDPTFVRISEVG